MTCFFDFEKSTRAEKSATPDSSGGEAVAKQRSGSGAADSGACF